MSTAPNQQLPFTACTPQYVLLHEHQRVGPQVAPLDANTNCVAVYGFSDEKHFAAFRERSSLPVTPYPLVRIYLREETETAGSDVKLIVLDALGPEAPSLNAATMPAVLQALEQHASQVDVAYRLLRDPQSNTYQVQPQPE